MKSRAIKTFWCGIITRSIVVKWPHSKCLTTKKIFFSRIFIYPRFFRRGWKESTEKIKGLWKIFINFSSHFHSSTYTPCPFFESRARTRQPNDEPGEGGKCCLTNRAEHPLCGEFIPIHCDLLHTHFLSSSLPLSSSTVFDSHPGRPQRCVDERKRKKDENSVEGVKMRNS